MSAISARLVKNVDGDIELNANLFGTAVMGFFLGDWTAAQARDAMNSRMAEDGYAALSATAEDDIAGTGTSMKTHYDALSNFNKHAYRDKVISYTQQLQNGALTESQWDGLMGI